MLLILTACTVREPTREHEPYVPYEQLGDSDPPMDSWPKDSDDSDEPVDTGPFDEDGDGSQRSEDCDDDDASIHPGADEAWDGKDNDCDGTIDGVGSYSGTLKMKAVGWFEGDKYSFDLDCPATLDRSLLESPFVVTCTPDPDDADAQRLLGSTLRVEPEDPYMWELDAWSDQVMFTSDDWDTRGDGTLSWQDFETVAVVLALDTTWLDVTGSGKLRR